MPVFSAGLGCMSIDLFNFTPLTSRPKLSMTATFSPCISLLYISINCFLSIDWAKRCPNGLSSSHGGTEVSEKSRGRETIGNDKAISSYSQTKSKLDNCPTHTQACSYFDMACTCTAGQHRVLSTCLNHKINSVRNYINVHTMHAVCIIDMTLVRITVQHSSHLSVCINDICSCKKCYLSSQCCDQHSIKLDMCIRYVSVQVIIILSVFIMCSNQH